MNIPYVKSINQLSYMFIYKAFLSRKVVYINLTHNIMKILHFLFYENISSCHRVFTLQMKLSLCIYNHTNKLSLCLQLALSNCHCELTTVPMKLSLWINNCSQHSVTVLACTLHKSKTTRTHQSFVVIYFKLEQIIKKLS